MKLWELLQFGILAVGIPYMLFQIASRCRLLFAAWAFFIVQGLASAYGILCRWPMFEAAHRLKSWNAVMSLVTFPLIILVIPFRIFRHWRHVAVAFGVLETILFTATGHGLFLANSFSGGFIALCLGLAPRWYLIPVLLWGVFYTGGSTAYLVLLAMSFVFLKRARDRGIAVLLIAVILTVGFVHQEDELWKDSGRFYFWGQYFKWWWAETIPITGTGLGTFEYLGQVTFGPKAGYIWHQMHNDFLQALFEVGIPGFLLFTGVYTQALWLTRNRPRTLAPLLGVGAFALTYHPVYMPVSALVILCLLRETYREQEV